MIRIICSECKNAYLQNKGDKYVCPSCGATVGAETENLILGIQFYNEANLSEAADCLMKHIVKNGAEPRAIFYKALCDTLQTIDADTDSLSETYEKLLDCFKDLNKEDYPQYIALANDEMKKIERELASLHVRSLENADAEKIKTEVAAIIALQDEAKKFRLSLIDVVNDYNETASAKLSARFSECYLVGVDVATETGNKTYAKIIEDINNHTVFTGILSNNIKNLEIYLRCIVRFFKKSHDKFEFLKNEAQKFTELAALLQKGQYNTIKGVESVSDKLVKESYDFLYESYNEHYDEQIDMQTETIVILEPEVNEEVQEIVEEATEETAGETAEETAEETTEETTEETAEETTEETAEETAEETTEETAEEFEKITEETDDFVLVVDDNDETEEVSEVTEETTEETEEVTNEAEDVTEEVEGATEAEDVTEAIADNDIIEIEVEAVEDEPATQEAVIEDISSSSVEDASNSEIKTLAEIKADNSAQAEKSTEDDASADDSDAVITIENAPEEASNTDEAAAEDKKPVSVKKKKSKKGKIIFILIIIAALAFAGYKYVPGIINNFKYEKATTLAADGSFTEAIAIYKELGDYSDSKEKVRECTYNSAVALEEAENHTEARLLYESLGEYKDCLTRVKSCAYNEALALLDNEKYDDAAKLFSDLADYGNSLEMVKECTYRKALALTENGEYQSAIELLATIKEYSDVADKINEAKYLYVTNNLDEKNKTTVKYLNELTKAKYRNSAELRKELLGSTEVPSADVKAFVNYDYTDLKTSLTELDNTKRIYFHVVVNDKALYGKKLTLKYTTQFGYSQTEAVTVNEGNTSAVMMYPATQYKNYKVVFELLNSDGTKIASQTITF